jgi:hypothetical protein
MVFERPAVSDKSKISRSLADVRRLVMKRERTGSAD